MAYGVGRNASPFTAIPSVPGKERADRDIAYLDKRDLTGLRDRTATAVSPLSFHSLRHNTTSWLKKAGVPEAVVRDIIGHESALVSRQYTHVDDETKRKAIQNLPVLG